MNPQQKIDQYIAQAPAFAQPICQKLRALILQTVPDMRESYKWSSPVYERNGLVCGMAAFRQHVNLSFFLGAYLEDPAQILVGQDSRSMRTIKFKNVAEVNETVLKGYILQAAHLDPKLIDRSDKTISIPDDFAMALSQNPPAQTVFDNFAYTHRKEYVRWVEEAKKLETRYRRIEKAVQMIAANQKFS